ncbi:MAG TPA: hypothetical protein VE175_05505 [Woeseiaceae bacterium]|jgi:hypothetical protein|nr:hypothetical protein [Woeseiaceae bacterium]
MSVKLRSNVTVEDFEKFYVEQVLPEYEKNWPGLKGYLLQNFRDEAKNQFAIVWLFETTEARNRYFDEAGTPNERANELERAALAKVKPIEDKLKKLYGEYTVRYTNEDDWVVQ